MRRLGTGLLILGAVVWLGLPAASVWWLSREASSTALADPATTYVPVQANLDPVLADVDLFITRSGAPVLVAPSLSGLVEQVSVAPGAVITSGTPVLLAGGISRIAFATERPFARPLARGIAGPDVPMLNGLLASMGMPAGSGTAVGSQTEAGIRALGRSLGAGNAVTTFDPGWIVFLPITQMTVTSTSLIVGAPVPAAGQIMVTGQSFLVSAQLVSPGAITVPEPTPGSGDGEQAPATPEVPENLPLVSASPETALSFSGIELELDSARTALSPAGLIALADLAPPESVLVAASLSTPAGDGEFAVPPAALFPGLTDDTCVLRRRAGTRESIQVEEVGGTYDRTIVTGDLRVGDELALSPPAEDRRCS